MIGLGLIGLGASASAQDYRQEYQQDSRYERGDNYRSHSHRSLRGEVDHVNRMYAHVRGEMRAYGAGRHLWRQYEHLSGEIHHVNYVFNHRQFDPYRLQGEIEHIHGELHRIEQELRVRESGYYRWN
ncbi:MAG: hypothetical protein QOI04_2085 [Verrucomicrobiota bacterium]